MEEKIVIIQYTRLKIAKNNFVENQYYSAVPMQET